MRELAELIYSDFRVHKTKTIAKMSSHFSEIENYKVKFRVLIDDTETLMNLFKMTPYYWKASEKEQCLIGSTQHLELTCDFHIKVFKSTSSVTAEPEQFS